MRAAAWEAEVLGGRLAVSAAVAQHESAAAAIATAYHEAGHVVAAVLAGYEVQSASIFSTGDDSVGRCVVLYPPVKTCAAADLEAPVHYAGAAVDTLRRHRRGGSCYALDFQHVEDLAEEVYGEHAAARRVFVGNSLERAVAVVSAPDAWAAVEAVARELIVNGTGSNWRFQELVHDPSSRNRAGVHPAAWYHAAQERQLEAGRADLERRRRERSTVGEHGSRRRAVSFLGLEDLADFAGGPSPEVIRAGFAGRRGA